MAACADDSQGIARGCSAEGLVQTHQAQRRRQYRPRRGHEKARLRDLAHAKPQEDVCPVSSALNHDLGNSEEARAHLREAIQTIDDLQSLDQRIRNMVRLDILLREATTKLGQPDPPEKD